MARRGDEAAYPGNRKTGRAGDIDPENRSRPRALRCLAPVVVDDVGSRRVVAECAGEQEARLLPVAEYRTLGYSAHRGNLAEAEAAEEVQINKFGEWAIEGRQPLQRLAEGVERGAGEILLTSMDRDGTREGFDLDLTQAIVDAVTVPVIASGGVGSIEHLVEGVVVGRADAVLAASIFHFREHTVADAKAHMSAAGIHVRPV